MLIWIPSIAIRGRDIFDSLLLNFTNYSNVWVTAYICLSCSICVLAGFYASSFNVALRFANRVWLVAGAWFWGQISFLPSQLVGNVAGVYGVPDVWHAVVDDSPLLLLNSYSLWFGWFFFDYFAECSSNVCSVLHFCYNVNCTRWFLCTIPHTLHHFLEQKKGMDMCVLYIP